MSGSASPLGVGAGSADANRALSGPPVAATPATVDPIANAATSATDTRMVVARGRACGCGRPRPRARRRLSWRSRSRAKRGDRRRDGRRVRSRCLAGRLRRARSGHRSRSTGSNVVRVAARRPHEDGWGPRQNSSMPRGMWTARSIRPVASSSSASRTSTSRRSAPQDNSLATCWGERLSTRRCAALTMSLIRCIARTLLGSADLHTGDARQRARPIRLFARVEHRHAVRPLGREPQVVVVRGPWDCARRTPAVAPRACGLRPPARIRSAAVGRQARGCASSRAAAAANAPPTPSEAPATATAITTNGRVRRRGRCSRLGLVIVGSSDRPRSSGEVSDEHRISSSECLRSGVGTTNRGLRGYYDGCSD